MKKNIFINNSRKPMASILDFTKPTVKDFRMIQHLNLEFHNSPGQIAIVKEDATIVEAKFGRFLEFTINVEGHDVLVRFFKNIDSLYSCVKKNKNIVVHGRLQVSADQVFVRGIWLSVFQ